MNDCCCTDRTQIIALLNKYATCLDSREWAGLDEVFHPDATAHYGSPTQGRSAIVTAIRSFLGGCGPSQHLLGNYDIHIDADHATSTTQARVIHLGAGERKRLTPYEAIGTYSDEHIRTLEGWRIASRRFDVRISTGEIGVLQPG